MKRILLIGSLSLAAAAFVSGSAGAQDTLRRAGTVARTPSYTSLMSAIAATPAATERVTQRNVMASDIRVIDATTVVGGENDKALKTALDTHKDHITALRTAIGNNPRLYRRARGPQGQARRERRHRCRHPRRRRRPGVLPQIGDTSGRLRGAPVATCPSDRVAASARSVERAATAVKSATARQRRCQRARAQFGRQRPEVSALEVAPLERVAVAFGSRALAARSAPLASRRLYYRPVLPKPPAPRAVSPTPSASSSAGDSCRANTSCAIRSPRRIVTASLPPFWRITFSSPR